MTEVIRILKNIYKPAKPVKPGAEDTADRLNFVWTPVLLLVCSLVVFGKEYISKPIYCIYSGQNNNLPNGWGDFADSYCWAHGTYAGSVKMTGFQNGEEQRKYWKETISSQRLTYYQWVPFFLLAQCVMVYMPKLAWQFICNQRFGSDIYSLISLSAESNIADEKTFHQLAARIADVMERMLLFNREFRSGRLQHIRTVVYNQCCLLPSKRQGTVLSMLYLLVKLFCVFNALGQLVLMAVFLGFWRRGIVLFGWTMLRNLGSGRGWQETATFFPIQTFCYVQTRFDLGSKDNALIGNCSLPVNILNEKIFIVLFFWFLFLAAVTTLSIVRWLYRLLCTCNRVHLVKRYLHMSDPCLQVENFVVGDFIAKFLRHDGTFLMLMLGQTSDKVITSEVVRLLFERWREKHHDCDLRGRNRSSSQQMEGKVSPRCDNGGKDKNDNTLKKKLRTSSCTSAADAIGLTSV